MQPKKTLKSAWYKWTMENHTFSNIKLTDGDLKTISGAVMEYLSSEADHLASNGVEGDELAAASRVKDILPSLKYFFPAVPKPMERPKPLSSDQSAQNVIFMKEANKLWRKAAEELNNRIIEFIARTVKGSNKSTPRIDEERERKGKAASEGKDDDMGTSNSRANIGDSGYDTMEERRNKAKRLEQQCLNEMGIKQLKKWLEEDEDAKIANENEDAASKLKEKKDAFDSFIKKKNG